MSKSKDFEDDRIAGDGRRATPNDAVNVKAYLMRKNRTSSAVAVTEELVARNFKAAPSTIARYLYPNGKDGPPATLQPENEAEKRRANVKGGKKFRAKKAAEETGGAAANVQTEVDKVTPDQKMEAELAKIPTVEKLLAADNSSTQLAIEENRTRMALNIVMMRTAMVYAKALMRDPRVVAPFMDAATAATKLSGGASIDIQIPSGPPAAIGNGAANGNGHGMIDVTPQKSGLAADLEEFRRKKAAERDKRA